MATLGVSDSRNSSAVLINSDGSLHGLQEERPTRAKNYCDIPEHSIR
jgi:predicted NodU family carbamoyl transferase